MRNVINFSSALQNCKGLALPACWSTIFIYSMKGMTQLWHSKECKV